MFKPENSQFLLGYMAKKKLFSSVDLWLLSPSEKSKRGFRILSRSTVNYFWPNLWILTFLKYFLENSFSLSPSYKVRKKMNFSHLCCIVRVKITQKLLKGLSFIFKNQLKCSYCTMVSLFKSDSLWSHLNSLKKEWFYLFLTFKFFLSE